MSLQAKLFDVHQGVLTETVSSKVIPPKDRLVVFSTRPDGARPVVLTASMCGVEMTSQALFLNRPPT